MTRLGETLRVAGTANAPHVLRHANPHYPNDAVRARIQGPVMLEVLIDESGKVSEAKVTKGLPKGLSEAAAEAVRQWVFEPVIAQGKAVPALIDVVINFKL